jgi:1-aminocyclopropane-1-carboxylate deaminase/D-cysteine desulfhydrase-like pyridoxal-dependent ACC family enzyme
MSLPSIQTNWELLLHHPPSPLEELDWPVFQAQEIRVFIKRDDQLLLEAFPGDQAFCGNKWRKLKYNLISAKAQGYQQLLTFGGAFSNHIAATASAGFLFGFKTVGIIRGERIEPLNRTLAHAERCGMELQFWSRARFQEKSDAQTMTKLALEFPAAYILPEGGTNELAFKGCAELAAEILAQSSPDYIAVSCGTGGTLAGMIPVLDGRAMALGFSALKGDFHATAIEEWLAPKTYANWQILTEYHGGGYAKMNAELQAFLTLCKAAGLALDPIYTGKALMGLVDLAEKGFFRKGSEVCFVHSGGLQGIPDRL